MSPQSPPAAQTKCSGLLVWEAADSVCAATCYGVTSPLRGAYVDLVEHGQGRDKPSHDSTLHNLSCIGSAVYQQQPDAKTGVIPAPACIGIEFQRYRQVLAQSQASISRAPGDQVPSYHQQHHVPSAAHDIELLHADRHRHVSPSSASSSSSSSNSSVAAENYRHQAAARPGDSSSSGNGGDAAPMVTGPEYQGRPSLVQRLQELHAEVSERLEGKDPLWFGKAFMARAAINWDSMKGMAGQVLESAKADLGFATKSDETK